MNQKLTKEQWMKKTIVVWLGAMLCCRHQWSQSIHYRSCKCICGNSGGKPDLSSGKTHRIQDDRLCNRCRPDQHERYEFPDDSHGRRLYLPVHDCLCLLLRVSETLFTPYLSGADLCCRLFNLGTSAEI